MEESGVTSAEESDTCLQGKVYKGTKEVTSSRIVYEVDRRRSVRRDEKRVSIMLFSTEHSICRQKLVNF